jgi:mRNA interferase RelE/StbE
MRNPYKGFKVYLSKRAQKVLGDLTRESRLGIIEHLDRLVKQSQVSDIKKLKNYSTLYRQRIGNYRLVFEPNTENKIIYVHIIAHRKDIYKKVSRLK